MTIIKSFSEKFPRLYSFLQKKYYLVLFFLEKITGTTFQEWRWKIRHIFIKKWAQGYIENIGHPHRTYLIETISHHAPFKTVLEIGSNAGPNLYLLANRFPDALYYGIDISKNAIAHGKKWFKRQNISNVNLSVGRADKLDLFETKSIDIVFTDATLLYIGPDKIRHILAEIIRIARKALFLLEFHFDSDEIYQYYDAHWIYNYSALFREYLPYSAIHISRLPPESWNDTAWQKYGALIEIYLE